MSKMSEKSKTGSKSKKKIRKRVIAIVLIVALVGTGTFLYLRRNATSTSTSDTEMVTYTVATGNISETLSGSGTLEPANSYSVTTLVTGDILSSDFEEGDIVDKDTLLYVVDSTDAENSLTKSEDSLEQTQRNYDRTVETLDDLNVKATLDGRLIDLEVEVGDSVSAGETVATIRNSDTMSIVLPFVSEDAKLIAAGDMAIVTLDGTFESIEGVVTAVSNVDDVQTGNVLSRDVTIEVSNPGGITPTTSATATVGTLACLDAAIFDYKEEGDVKALVSGDVTAINVSTGTFVHKDDVLFTMESDTLSDSLQDAAYSLDNAKLSLESQQEELDNYSITSPIYGTIIEKNYKAGDTLSSNAGTLCTIYDLSYLTMTLDVDELDISKVSVGQTVTITADAADGKTYEGTVTKINIKGTTSNGVTSYPVTIQVDDTDGLLPGMNVDAEIVVASTENALLIPISAVSRGNRVLVQSDATSATEASTSGAGPDSAANAGTDAGSGAMETTSLGGTTIPDGYTYVTVETGLSDEDYIEITSGLSEGDVIMYSQGASTTVTEVDSMFNNSGGPSDTGGMPGGGSAPSGGPGGGGF
ncbi:MAG: HlyD family secretion protein [Clostridiales bacterium]|nr:HlyD family secretion protein [Clostridiales bacterium]